MKRLGSSDSLGALMSICPATEEDGSGGNNHVYTREFQCMLEGLDEEGCVEESGSGQISEKKRRLSVHQVKALEKNFEVENKLEPERKVKLAQELGLQPRQVAVWFQNRRARWKTKQLERDYGVLKANYDALKHSFDSLRHDNESLLKEIRELKSKFHGEKDDSNVSVKEEAMVVCESDEKAESPPINSAADIELKYESFSNNNGGAMVGPTFYPDVKDGSSDSDSSAIFNEDNSSSPNNAGAIQSHQFMPTTTTTTTNATTTNIINCFQLSDNSKAILREDTQKAYQPQFVKIEEHNFFSSDGDESCNFFSDDQAPTLPWYSHDNWN